MATAAVEAENSLQERAARARALAWEPVAAMGRSCVWNSGRYTVVSFARIDNQLDHRYIGSVIVNQASGGSFEPAPGRTFFVGIKLTARQN